jgi:hypothetical protein
MHVWPAASKCLVLAVMVLVLLLVLRGQAKNFEGICEQARCLQSIWQLIRPHMCTTKVFYNAVCLAGSWRCSWLTSSGPLALA